MKIISQFKDYYDFIAHSYGGGDPALVLNRNRENKKEYVTVGTGRSKFTREWIDDHITVQIPNGGGAVQLPRANYTDAFRRKGMSSLDCETRLIGFCGYWIYFRRTREQSGFINGSRIEHKWSNWVLDDRPSYLYTTTQDLQESNPQKRDQLAVDVSIFTGRPYFEVSSNGEAIFDRYPILDNAQLDPENTLWFAKLLTPQDCYQRISNFLYEIRSQEHPSPMTDKQKVDSHGFDQASFRNTGHRIR